MLLSASPLGNMSRWQLVFPGLTVSENKQMRRISHHVLLWLPGMSGLFVGVWCLSTGHLAIQAGGALVGVTGLLVSMLRSSWSPEAPAVLAAVTGVHATPDVDEALLAQLLRSPNPRDIVNALTTLGSHTRCPPRLVAVLERLAEHEDPIVSGKARDLLHIRSEKGPKGG